MHRFVGYLILDRPSFLNVEFTVACLIAGTFDLTIDGHKYEKIDVHIAQAELLALVRNNGDYKQAHKWGSCYGKACASEHSCGAGL